MLIEIIIFLFLGLIAGLLAGMFGIGGGLVIVPVLIYCFTNLGFESEIIVQLAIGTSIATIIFTGFSSAYSHKLKDSIDYNEVKPVIFGIMFGALLGALTTVNLNGEILKKMLGIFLFIVSIHTLASSQQFSKIYKTNNFLSTFAGSFIGFWSNIFGIGGGLFSLPYFRAIGLNLKSSIGSSAACGVPIAIFGTLGFVFAGIENLLLPKYSIGYVYLPALITISFTSVIMARFGAELTHSLSHKNLKKLLALLFVLISIYMFNV
tara:strand:+ start:1895 stop:2686 length:792 start_codon:yes stop_codon:yes gene_type:complete